MTYIKKIFLLLILILPITKLYSQDTLNIKKLKVNSFQFEFLGHGVFYSINYERILIKNDFLKTTIQGGFSYYPPYEIRDLWIPILINELISLKNQNHNLEIGMGYMYTPEITNKNTYSTNGYFTGRIGYRYNFPNEKYLLRIAYIQIFEHFKPLEYSNWAGLSFGYKF